MTYRVKLTGEAQDDLLRLYDYLLERELSRVDGAADFAIADKAISARMTLTEDKVSRGFGSIENGASPLHCTWTVQSMGLILVSFSVADQPTEHLGYRCFLRDRLAGGPGGLRACGLE